MERSGLLEAQRREAARLTREAMRLLTEEKWDQAEGVLEDALSRAPGDPVNLYNLACARARLGRAERAIECLEQAAAAGFTDFVLIARDPDLAPLREQPRFKALLADKEQWQRRAAEAVVRSLRERFGDDYLYGVDEEQKLIFATNVDEETLDELKASLRLQAASQHKDLFGHAPDAFVTVVVPSAEDYRRLMRARNVGGVYVDGSKTLIAERMGDVMRHEFTHALHAADRAPLGQDHAPWVAEGLGVIYETAGVVDGVMTPRGDNPRFVVAQSAARRGSLIPLARLAKMGPQEFLSRPNLTYPEAGSILFYLRERGLLRKFYEAYKKTYDADATGLKALAEATGQTPDEFESAWKQWLVKRAEEGAADDPRRGNDLFLGVRLRPTRAGGGLTVAALHEHGPAEVAGVREGDELVSINGRKVRDYAGLRPAIGSYAPGKTVTVRVRREGKEIDLPLKLAARPNAKPAAQ